MSFVEELRVIIDDWVQADEYHKVDEFWAEFVGKGKTQVGNHELNLLSFSGGPNESNGENYEFAFTVDGVVYVADVAYDSYEFAGYDYQVYTGEPFQFTETRYKRLARAR